MSSVPRRDRQSNTSNNYFISTSPSIYANFESIIASDMCGINVISSTMISFSPGELSTIGGRPNVVSPPVQSTQRFDFRDLPCPPQSIMVSLNNWPYTYLADVNVPGSELVGLPRPIFFCSSRSGAPRHCLGAPVLPPKGNADLEKYNRYKPEAGEPYRPLIAMPSQLKRKIPWFSSCLEYFTAYDPPHALPTVTAFGPGPIPGRHAGAQPPTPAPSATLDPGARRTTPSAVPVPPVTDDPAVKRPTATIGSVPLPTPGNPNSGPSDPDRESDGKQAGDPKHGSDSKQNSDTSGDLSQGDKSEESNDPKKGSGNSDDPNQGKNSPSGNDPKQDSGINGDSSQSNDLKQNSANSDDSSRGGTTKGSGDTRNDEGTGRDSSKFSDAQKSRDTSGNPGREVDSNLPSIPFRPTVAVTGDQDTSPLVGSVVPDEPNRIDKSNAVSGESERNSWRLCE